MIMIEHWQPIDRDRDRRRTALTLPRLTCLCVCVGGGGAMVRWCWVNFQYQGGLLIWMIVGQEPAALAVYAGGGCLDVFFLSSINSPFLLLLSDSMPDLD